MAEAGALFPAPNTAVPAQIDAERRWLIEQVLDTDLAAVSQADLIRVAGVMAPPGSTGTVLDTLP